MLLTSPDHDLYGDEPVYWDGQAVGHVRGALLGLSGSEPRSKRSTGSARHSLGVSSESVS